MRGHTILISLVAAMALASEPQARTWQSDSGQFSTEAELVRYKDGQVQLKKADGQVITVALARLSEADRRYVESHVQAASEREVRSWTSADGKHKMEAALLVCDEGLAWLRKPNGEVITVSLEKLGEADRAYVEAGRAAAASSLSAPVTLPMELKRLDLETWLGRNKKTAEKDDDSVLYFTQGQFNRRGYIASGTIDKSLQQLYDGLKKLYGQTIHQEPAQLNSKHPVRMVAQLGADRYGFLVDATDADGKGYGRLYFDRNHDGSLADESPLDGQIDAEKSREKNTQYRFPRLDLTIAAGGKPFEYAVFPSVYWVSYRNDEVFVFLHSAVYREAELSLEGKAYRVLLLDNNGNGRFDDFVQVSVGTQDSQLDYDTLLLLPLPRSEKRESASRELSRLQRIDGNAYDVQVTPSGDQLTLSRSELPVGHVVIPKDVKVWMYRKDTLLEVSGETGTPAAMPVGQWRLLWYAQESDKPKVKIVAHGTPDCRPLEIRAGQTTKLPFGPPYTPVVEFAGRREDKLLLSLAMVGAGGERCRNLRINDEFPKPPELVVRNPSGKEIEQGRFEVMGAG